MELYVLVVAPAQLGQVGQLLDPDDGVVEGRLQRLGHGVGQDHRYHHRQDVGDLTGQLKDDDGGGDCVGDRSRQGRRACRGGGEIKEERRRDGIIEAKASQWWKQSSSSVRFKVVNKEDPWVALRSSIHQNDESNQLQ